MFKHKGLTERMYVNNNNNNVNLKTLLKMEQLASVQMWYSQWFLIHLFYAQ